MTLGHHNVLIVEHDSPAPRRITGDGGGYLAQHLRQTSREATVLLYAPALDPHLQEMAELADRVFCIYDELTKGGGTGGENDRIAEDSGSVLVRWPWRQQAKPIEPRLMVNRAMELETAKEILAEVFHARPSDVEEMIKRRLEETGPDEREEGQWPATFCLVEW